MCFTFRTNDFSSDLITASSVQPRVPRAEDQAYISGVYGNVLIAPPRAVGANSEPTTVPSKIAIVVMRGRLAIGPFHELNPT